MYNQSILWIIVGAVLIGSLVWYFYIRDPILTSANFIYSTYADYQNAIFINWLETYINADAKEKANRKSKLEEYLTSIMKKDFKVIETWHTGDKFLTSLLNLPEKWEDKFTDYKTFLTTENKGRIKKFKALIEQCYRYGMTDFSETSLKNLLLLLLLNDREYFATTLNKTELETLKKKMVNNDNAFVKFNRASILGNIKMTDYATDLKKVVTDDKNYIKSLDDLQVLTSTNIADSNLKTVITQLDTATIKTVSDELMKKLGNIPIADKENVLAAQYLYRERYLMLLLGTMPKVLEKLKTANKYSEALQICTFGSKIFTEMTETKFWDVIKYVDDTFKNRNTREYGLYVIYEYLKGKK